MGALAVAAIGLAAAGTTAYMGNKQNKDAIAANEQAKGESEEDYNTRIKAAAKAAKELNSQYNKVVKNRPNLTWPEFVKSKLSAIDDPFARQVYTTAKAEDFERLRQFAQQATDDNVDNLLATADKISGGSFMEFVNKRNDLIRNTDAAGRYARAYELAAPVRTNASTVKYDNQGRLIEGQRADKLAFGIANEVQTQVEQEQKADLRQAEMDRLPAALSQQEKAKSFTQFFDPTGFANQAEQERMLTGVNYQQMDEQRSFDLYKMFAGAAAGITPVQPQYQDPNAGNAMIASGIKSGTTALTDYYKTQQANKVTAPATANTYG